MPSCQHPGLVGPILPLDKRGTADLGFSRAPTAGMWVIYVGSSTWGVVYVSQPCSLTNSPTLVLTHRTPLSAPDVAL